MHVLLRFQDETFSLVSKTIPLNSKLLTYDGFLYY